MVGIKVRTHMAKEKIDAVPLKINLYAQWLSKTLSYKFAIKIHSQALGGYINAILRDINLHVQWLSQYVRPVLSQYSVPKSLSYMLRDNLDTCAINNIPYKNTLGE